MRGVMIFSHNMEDIEALGTRALLRRAGLNITALTFENTLDIKTSYGLMVKADGFANEIDIDQFDFIVIPGGKYVSLVVDQDIHIKALCKSFHKQHKLVAAICAGPRFLGQAGLLNNIHFTAYPGSEADALEGIYHPDMKSMRDKNIITGRSAGSVYEFSFEIIKYFLGEDKLVNLIKNIKY